MARSISAEDYRLRGSIEALRTSLLNTQFANRWDRPLAYWALPADRRLPLALLGMQLGELLQLPYESLAATPGIGQKKLRMLITLLQRAADSQPIEEPSTPVASVVAPSELPVATQAIEQFNPVLVAEHHWEQWTETVRRHDLGQLKLGRLAPSLQELPTVIWNTPLSTYFGRSISEIRQWKTYGEKRVRVVLEVFHIAHQMLSGSQHHHQLAFRLVPKFVSPLEDWIAETLGRNSVPDDHEVRQALALPLLNQISVDVGDSVQELAAGRLGIETEPHSVLNLSRNLGVTRARVYQLLETCAKVMDVRWPEGRIGLTQLNEKFQRQGAGGGELGLFCRVRDLFFPAKHEQESQDNVPLPSVAVQEEKPAVHV